MGLRAVHEILTKAKRDATDSDNFPLFFGRYRFVCKIGQGAFSQTFWSVSAARRCLPTKPFPFAPLLTLTLTVQWPYAQRRGHFFLFGTETGCQGA